MTNLEHDILKFELFQISVFLDELNEMLKKDIITLIKLKHKRYKAKQWFYLPSNSWGYFN